MKEEQGEDPVRRNERAARIEHAETVRVPVLSDGKIGSLRTHPLPGRFEIHRDRLRMHSAEKRIPLRPERDDAGSAPARDVGDEPPRGAVHGVGDERQSRAADRGEIDAARERVAVGAEKVDELDAGPAPSGSPPETSAPRPPARRAPAARLRPRGT